MTSLRVLELVGENAVTVEGGEALFASIADKIEHEEVVLDFAGVTVCASPFFNASIGRLVGLHDADVLRKRLRFVNLSPTASELMRRVIENSREYYARSPEQRLAVDEAVQGAPSQR
jgi:hypothetical protein